MLLTALFNTFFLLLLTMAEKLLLPAFWLDEVALGGDVMRSFFYAPGALFARMFGVCAEEGVALLGCQPGSFAFSGTAGLVAALLGFSLGWEKFSLSWKGAFLRTAGATAGWFVFLFSSLFIASHAVDVLIHTRVTGLAGFMAKNYAGTAGQSATGWAYIKFMLPFALFGMLLGADQLSFTRGEGFLLKEGRRRIFTIWGGAMAGYIIAAAIAAIAAANGHASPVVLLSVLPALGMLWGAIEFRPVPSAPARCCGFLLGAGLGFAPLSVLALNGGVLNPGLLALPALLMAAGLSTPELSALLPEPEEEPVEKQPAAQPAAAPVEEPPQLPLPEPEPKPAPSATPDESSETLRRFLAGTDLSVPLRHEPHTQDEENSLCDGEEEKAEPPLALTQKREDGVDYLYMEVDSEPQNCSDGGYPMAGGTDDETDA